MEQYEPIERVKELLKFEQHEQRSPEWFAQRAGKLTSSDVDTVLGNNKYAKPEEVLFKKFNLGKPFTGNRATQHGQKYEDEAIDHYCRLYNKKNYSFGLIEHPEISWLGGSPDDITHDGIVIEVKCPLYRKIEMGKVPEHYIGQVKMNMEICDLDKAVFIEYRPAHLTDDNEMILNIVEIDRDRKWFEGVYPILEKFRNDWDHYKKVGIEKHPKYEYYKFLSKERNVMDISEPGNDCLIVESDDDEN